MLVLVKMTKKEGLNLFLSGNNLVNSNGFHFLFTVLPGTATLL